MGLIENSMSINPMHSGIIAIWTLKCKVVSINIERYGYPLNNEKRGLYIHIYIEREIDGHHKP